jgi:hypothetical protein
MKGRDFFCNFVFAATFLMAFHASGQERASQPVYQDGECWIFKTVNKNYVGYTSGVSALLVNGDHKICFLQS